MEDNAGRRAADVPARAHAAISAASATWRGGIARRKRASNRVLGALRRLVGLGLTITAPVAHNTMKRQSFCCFAMNEGVQAHASDCFDCFEGPKEGWLARPGFRHRSVFCSCRDVSTPRTAVWCASCLGKHKVRGLTTGTYAHSPAPQSPPAVGTDGTRRRQSVTQSLACCLFRNCSSTLWCSFAASTMPSRTSRSEKR